MKGNKKLIDMLILIIYIMVFTIPILAVILIKFDNKVGDGYRLLWLLPLVFVIVSIFSINIMKNILKNITVAIIWGGYFIRFVLTPLFLKLGNYRIIFFRTVTAENIERGIILMAWELFVVFLFLELYLKIFKKRNVKSIKTDRISITDNSNKNIHFMLLLLFLFCVAIVIYIPEIMDSYTWIFADKKEIATINYNVESIAVRGTIKRALASLFVFIFNIIRYLIPVYLLKYVFIKFKKSKLGYILSFIICMIPFLVINESNIQPFFGLIFNVIMMTKLYPAKKKSIINTFIITGGLLILSVLLSKLYLLAKWQGTSGGESIALTFNAYFPGVGNVAAAYNVFDNNKWMTLFYDFISTIPFKNSLFPSIAPRIETLTSLFNSYNGTNGNIVPCISGAEYYVGPIFAPLLPAILCCYAIKMKVKADFSRNYWIYFFYIFYSIRIAMIPTLYNHISVIHILINQIIPMYFATIFLIHQKLENKQGITFLGGLRDEC